MDAAAGGLSNASGTISYSFEQLPIVFVEINSTPDGDGHWVRGGGTYDNTTLTYKIDGNLVGDSEQSLASGTVGWAAFDFGTRFYESPGSGSRQGGLAGATFGDNATLPNTGFVVLFLVLFIGLLVVARTAIRRRAGRIVERKSTNPRDK